MSDAIRAVSKPCRQGGIRHRRRLGDRGFDRRALLRAACAGRLRRHRRSRVDGALRAHPRRRDASADLHRLRPPRHRGAAGHRQARRRRFGSHHRPRQQCRERRSAQGDGRDARILERSHRGQPAPSVLRRAGRVSADEGGRRRVDRQFRLDQLDEQRGQLQRVHDVESGRARDDARTRAGLGRGPYPGQHGRARAGC